MTTTMMSELILSGIPLQAMQRGVVNDSSAALNLPSAPCRLHLMTGDFRSLTATLPFAKNQHLTTNYDFVVLPLLPTPRQNGVRRTAAFFPSNGGIFGILPSKSRHFGDRIPPKFCRAAILPSISRQNRHFSIFNLLRSGLILLRPSTRYTYSNKFSRGGSKWI